MARSGILYSDVAKAASQLTELGHPVTVDNVRKMLGDTGSKSTIAPYLRQWRENHALESESSRLKLPPSLLSAVQSLYEGMQQEAEIRFTEAEKLHEETVASMQTELQALKKRLEESAQAHQEVQMELRLSQKEHRKTLETLERERLQSLAQQQQITLLNQRLSDKLQHLQTQEEQLQQAHQQFEHFQAATMRQRQEETAMHEGRLQLAEQQLRKTQAQLSDVQAQSKAHETDLHNLSRLYEAALTSQAQLKQ
mgnify:FL=1